MNRSEILSSIAKGLVGNFREVARTLRAIFDGDLLGGNQTLTAPGEVLIVNIDENGRGQIVANIGGVALSTV